MGTFSRLQLQAIFVLWIICVANGAPYSKYGRTCKDIGCLPREVCVMSYESCSFNQQENVSCGRYPTCKKNTDGQSTQQNSGPFNPTTSKPNTNIWNFAPTTASTTTTTTTRRPWTTTTTTTTRRPWTTQAPFYNPSNPSYGGGGGGGGYFGNRYGDNSDYGGSSFTRPTTRYTTKRPSSGSSSSFDGFFSGLQNVLSGDIGKIIQGAIGGRGGSNSGSGGFGSFFGDTRPLSENKNYRGGLFNENQNSNTRTSNTYNAYPVTRYGEASAPPAASNPTPPQYGWKLS